MRDLDAALADLGDLLGDRAGLTYPRSRYGLLRRAAEARLNETGAKSADAYLRHVAGDTEELGRLVELATVGETYFFRHGEQLELLAREALAPLVAECRATGRPLTLWSAGCATGEEAYTLAILAAEQVAGTTGAGIRVVGSDVNEASLAQARRGVYGAWSFRAPLGPRERWFTTDGPRRRVVKQARELVTFERHNLATDFPKLPAALGGRPDVILCRNVLIYLDPRAVRRVIDACYDALAPGGWLVVAPVEASIPGLRRFEALAGERATVYRRPPDGVAPRRRTLRRTAEAPARIGDGVSRRPAAPNPPSRPPEPRPAIHAVDVPSRADRADAQADLESVRALAAAGRLDDARERCALQSRRAPSADAFLLLAAIEEARNDLAAAAAALRGACYLEPDHIGAQFWLGLLEWRSGSTRRANVRLRRAVALAEDCADADPIPGIDVSAGRLRSIAETMTR